MITWDQLSRVAIVGTSCSGKTTLAQKLATALGAPRIELDALYWGPKWTPHPTDQFRADVDRATAEAHWVCDGNYRAVRDLVWPRASCIVWLNFPFPLVFTRALTRTFSRCFRRTTLYADNRESFSQSFLSRDSILFWVVKSHWRLEREYLRELQQSQLEHARTIRLISPARAADFLSAAEQLASSQASKGSVI